MAGNKDFSDQEDKFNPYSQSSNKNKTEGNTSKSDNTNNSRSLLRNSENSATSKQSQKFGQDNESSSSWSNKVQGKSNLGPQKKGIEFRKKHKVATFLILILLGLGGFALGSTNTLLAPALNSLFTSGTNSAYAGYTLRSTKLQNYMLRNLNDATTHNFKFLNRYRHMSRSFRARLASNNIEVDGSGRNTKLLWTSKTGDIVEIDANHFDEFYLNNAEFRNDYSTAKRSRVVTFFDKVADRVYNWLGLSRNTLSDYHSTGDAETDAENFRNHMIEQSDNDSTSVRNRGDKGREVEVDDGDGNVNKVIVESGEMENQHIVSSDTNNTDSSIAQTKAKGYIGDIAQKASAGANTICGLLKIGNAISLTVGAMETAKGIKNFQNIMENVSKMMAGEGDATAINEVLNFFATSSTTEVEQYNNGVSFSGLNASSTEDDIINFSGSDSTISTKEVSGSPLEAQGVQAMMTGTKVSSDISNYSLERISSTITTMLGISVGALQGCNIIQATSAVISIAATFGTLGVSTIVDFGIKIVTNLAIGVAASAILGFAVPAIAKVLFMNTFESVTGIPAGEFFTMGSAAANFSNGRAGSGQVAASKEAVIQYNRKVKQVAALDAEVDRLNLSPFDTSSPNTFLGSIAYSLLPLTTSRTATNISTLINTTSKSLASITGIARADDESDSYMTTFGNDLGSCPTLDEMGAACDIYGSPIPISVLIDLDPEDSGYTEFLDKNLVCNDECEIKENGTLAKFIISNVDRSSPLGVPDTNILAAFEIGSVFTNSIPLLDSAVDIWDAARDAENMGWATGEYTIYTGDPEVASAGRSSVSNAEIAYAQRYIEDQRILDEISGDEGGGNPVTAFVNKWHEEHPLDNSPAGYIARITGLPKETAETVIAVAEYYVFLENYDIDTRIAMDNNTTKLKSGDVVVAEILSERYNFEKNPEHQETLTLISQNIIYADVRNRSYAV